MSAPLAVLAIFDLVDYPSQLLAAFDGLFVSSERRVSSEDRRAWIYYFEPM
jgi:hypothetical protein